jgi:hypothetical protein
MPAHPTFSRAGIPTGDWFADHVTCWSLHAKTHERIGTGSGFRGQMVHATPRGGSIPSSAA